jgi:hypothetical protein
LGFISDFKRDFRELQRREKISPSNGSFLILSLRSSRQSEQVLRDFDSVECLMSSLVTVGRLKDVLDRRDRSKFNRDLAFLALKYFTKQSLKIESRRAISIFEM